MDINNLMGDFNAFLGALGAFVLVIWKIRSGHKKDNRDAELDRKEWELWIMEQVKANSKDAMANMQDKYDDLMADFQSLSEEKDKMERQYLDQIALKEEENRNLRQKNEVLNHENDAYRQRFGKL